MGNNGNAQFEVLNKDRAEMVIFDKGRFSYKPDREEDYYDEALTNAVELALCPFSGLIDLLVGAEDIDEGAFRDVFVPLLRDASTKLENISNYLTGSLGEISLKYRKGAGFASTVLDKPMAVVFKPAEHLAGRLGLVKQENKKLRAVSGAKG